MDTYARARLIAGQFRVMIQEGLEQKAILFRCDGTRKTGFGHVSRCLALAEALRECGFACRFVGKFEAGAADLLCSASMAFDKSMKDTGGENDLCSTLQAIKDCRAEAIVVDSYLVGDTFIATLDRQGAPVLLIDDFGRLERYECSALLNFTVNAAHLGYPRRNQLYLLGPEYLSVRRRLRLLRRQMRPRTGNVYRLLVAIGGIDFFDLSRLVVQALLEIAPHLSVRVVVGRGYKHTRELALLVGGFHGESHVVVQLPDLAKEFAWADMCVCGGGLTKYESAYMGVPTAVLSQSLEQAQETKHFARTGLAVDLGWGREQSDTSLAPRLFDLIANSRVRESLSQAGLDFFPEDPTRRAAEAFAQVVNSRSRE